MASVTSSARSYKNNKKVEEVREVCQNRPEAEIIKVLEVFDNDVAKTIDAFMTGSYRLGCVPATRPAIST